MSGIDAGKTFLLAEHAIVGRAPECTIVIADADLSRRHFEIRWDGNGYEVRDLASSNGLLVNGAPVQTASLSAGDEIHAGQTVFRLEGPTEFLATVAPTLNAEAAPAAPGTLLAALTSTLQASPPGTLYAIVDGAQAFPLVFTARLMGHAVYSVFSGDLATTVAHVGPCLVALGERSGFLAKWVESIGTHAGVLFESPAGLGAIHAHLRQVFIATDEEGQEYFFRFYDPRVIRTFLPTCHPEELKEFFGPIAQWVVETEDGSAYSSYRLVEGRLTSLVCAGPVATGADRTAVH